MADIADANPIILKILNGVQAGVEVSLTDGSYTLGSGENDDIQLIDVSLKPGHLRVRVSNGGVEVAGGESALRTAAGATLPAHGEFQRVEPLEVLLAGTTRLAFGPRSAQWDTVSDDPGEVPPPGAPMAAPAPAPLPAWTQGRGRLIGPAAALLAVLLFAAWYAVGGPGRALLARNSAADDLTTTRTALDQFAFGRPVKTWQTVDGTVYASGFVADTVQRRALVNAVEKTAVPVRLRLYVLDGMRSEVDNLIAAEKLPIKAKLSGDGRLSLDGTVLNKAALDKGVALINDQVAGLSGIDNHVQTAADLLAEVQKLAGEARLGNYLLLRVDGDLIEVNGTLPSDKIDAWVGFLQAYAHRFASVIGLRSFVQLQGPDGRLQLAPTDGLTAAGASAKPVAVLDPGLLNDGSATQAGFKPDAAQGAGHPDTTRPSEPVRPLEAAAQPAKAGSSEADTLRADALRVAAPTPAAAPLPSPATVPDTPKPVREAPAAPAAAKGEPVAVPAKSDTPSPLATEPAIFELGNGARDLVLQWRNGQLGRSGKDQAVGQGLDRISREGSGATTLPDWYLPVMSKPADGTQRTPCWSHSSVTVQDLPTVLFWLDLLSTTEQMSLTTFSRSAQLLLLEVALDPNEVEACAKLLPAAGNAADHSLYLTEIRRNPDFVRFITRGLTPFDMDVAGISLAADRYVLTQAGRRFFEGAAPNQSSRLALVGELGAVIQANAGLSVVLFKPDLAWETLP